MFICYVTLIAGINVRIYTTIKFSFTIDPQARQSEDKTYQLKEFSQCTTDLIGLVYKYEQISNKNFFQVISSDEKCASAILHIEALMKAEPSNPEFVIPDFNPETVGGADDEFLDNLFQHGLATFPDVAASADNIEGFSFDESTLDFSDLCHLGIGVSGDKFLEFQ